ncbi:MAG: hypothetical protein JKY08_01905 [Flavobacteriaceae bacterium]|nr:hypothetical protein [Flavobacteriaceae bacterium]
MKKGYIVFLFLGLVSCTVSEVPEFVGIENVVLQKFDGEEIELVASLKFLNPNSLGGSLKCKNIKVLVNDLNVGVLSSEVFDVPSKSEFTVPLVAKIPYHELFKSSPENLLKNLLSVVLEQQIRVKYSGHISYTFGKLNFDYPLEFSDTISLKRRY